MLPATANVTKVTGRPAGVAPLTAVQKAQLLDSLANALRRKGQTAQALVIERRAQKNRSKGQARPNFSASAQKIQIIQRLTLIHNFALPEVTSRFSISGCTITYDATFAHPLTFRSDINAGYPILLYHDNYTLTRTFDPAALGRATGITNSVTSNGVEDGSGKFHFLFVRDSDNDKDTSLLTALLKICSNNGVTHSTTRTPDKITGMWSINGVVGLNSIFYSDGTVIANYSAKGRWKRSSTNMYVAAFPLHPTIKLSYSAQRDQLTGDFVTEANTIGRDALYQRMPK